MKPKEHTAHSHATAHDKQCSATKKPCQTPIRLSKRLRSPSTRSPSTHSNSKFKSQKIPWLKEEDDIIIKLVESHGEKKWKHFEKHLPRRTGKQCRERWFNQLDPKIKKTPWSKEEDMILYIKQKQLGNMWKKLTEFLPGRPENAIKNHWNVISKGTKSNIMQQFDHTIQEHIQSSQCTIEQALQFIYSFCCEKNKKETTIYYDALHKPSVIQNADSTNDFSYMTPFKHKSLTKCVSQSDNKKCFSSVNKTKPDSRNCSPMSIKLSVLSSSNLSPTSFYKGTPYSDQNVEEPCI